MELSYFLRRFSVPFSCWGFISMAFIAFWIVLLCFISRLFLLFSNWCGSDKCSSGELFENG